MRFRIGFVAVRASLTLGAIFVPVAGANGTPNPPKYSSIAPLYTLPVKGSATNGSKFDGKFGIHRFVVGTLNGKRNVYALGTLTAMIKGHRVTRYNVMIPAALKGASAGSAKAAAMCPVLNPVLAPIKLNLLGLQVTLGGGTLGKLVDPPEHHRDLRINTRIRPARQSALRPEHCA